MTWLGRQMMSYSKNGTSISYTYDADGLRTSKTVNGVKHNYYYVDGQLRYERNGDNYEIYYTYDADGRPVLATKRDLVAKKNYQYYLITNTRGDIIETRDDYGNVSAKFVYDAWGKLISVTNASGTPLASDSFAYQISLKYRGYVYDNETGLYYLQSRYYDPETGRFLNADDVGFIGYSGEQLSYNAFAYCENNAVVRIDTTGKTYSYADRVVNIDWNRIAKDIGKDVLLSFLTNYLLKGFRVKEKSIRIEYNEKTQMFNAKVKYYKSDYNVNSFNVEYGDQTGWWNSTFEDNLSSMGLALNYSELVYDAGFSTSTEKENPKIADIIIFTVMTIIALVYNDYEAESYGKIYREVWGMDGNGREDRILFKISSEKQLNGYYLFNYSTHEGEKIEI